MTPDQLQRFAEAGGWTDVTVLNGELRGIPPYAQGRLWESRDFANDLQACCDVLERFCEKGKWMYTLTQIPEDEGCGQPAQHFNVMIDPRGDHERFDDLPEACAATKTEAIIAAVLKASEVK